MDSLLGSRPLLVLLPEPWEVIDDLLTEAEAERVNGLTDAEVEAEMRAEGIDPANVPSTEEMLARGRKRVGTATTDNVRVPSKSRSGRGMRRIDSPYPVMSSRRAVRASGQILHGIGGTAGRAEPLSSSSPSWSTRRIDPGHPYATMRS